MENSSSWASVLFDEGDFVCSSSQPTATSVTPQPATFVGEYTCINALDGLVDHEPIANYHRANLPRRADANVTKLRTMLVEFDERPLEDQVPYVNECAMPYSLVTFSGSKSFHFLIVLDEPLADRFAYRDLVTRVYRALGGKAAGLDEKTKNPSRFSRTPGVVRESTGLTQELVYVGPRVSLASLESWLLSRGVGPEKRERRQPVGPAGPHWRRPLSNKTFLFLFEGATGGEWNQAFFNAACDLVRCGYTDDEVYQKLEQVTGSLEAVTLRTIDSAILRARADDERESV